MALRTGEHFVTCLSDGDQKKTLTHDTIRSSGTEERGSPDQGVSFCAEGRQRGSGPRDESSVRRPSWFLIHARCSFLWMIWLIGLAC